MGLRPARPGGDRGLERSLSGLAESEGARRPVGARHRPAGAARSVGARLPGRLPGPRDRGRGRPDGLWGGHRVLPGSREEGLQARAHLAYAPPLLGTSQGSGTPFAKRWKQNEAFLPRGETVQFSSAPRLTAWNVLWAQISDEGGGWCHRTNSLLRVPTACGEGGVRGESDTGPSGCPGCGFSKGAVKARETPGPPL